MTMQAEDIKPYEKNAKKHDKSQLLLLAKIVQEVGWRQNVEVNQEGVIIAGHCRWLAWKEYKDVDSEEKHLFRYLLRQ